jgi:hypothetical protein
MPEERQGGFRKPGKGRAKKVLKAKKSAAAKKRRKQKRKSRK